MNTVLHLVRKDLRYSRWLIVLTWLVAACVLWLSTVPIELRDEELGRMRDFRYGSWILLFLTIGRMVQLDPPLSETSYLGSRPVSHGEWLASKSLAALLIILPMALFPVLLLFFMGLRPGFIHLSLAYAEEILTLAVVAAFAMTLAARNQSPSKFYSNVLALFLSAFIVFILCLILRVNIAQMIYFMMDHEWWRELHQLSLSRFLAAQGIILTGLAAAMLHFSRNHHRGHLTCAMIGTAIATILGICFWPINFVKWTSPAEAEAPRSEWPDPSKIIFKFGQDLSSPEDETCLILSSHSWADAISVDAMTYLSGLPNGWSACNHGFDSVITLDDQTSFRSHGNPRLGVDARMILPEFANHSVDENLMDRADLGLIPKKAWNPGTALHGSVRIPFIRPVILARLPLRAGETTFIGNRRIRILKVEAKETRLFYQYSVEEPMIRMLGGSMSEPWGNLDTIVVNASKGQRIAWTGRSGGIGRPVGPYLYAIIDYDGPISTNTREELPISTEWVEGAELIVTGSQSGGALTRQFKFKPFDSKKEPWLR